MVVLLLLLWALGATAFAFWLWREREARLASAAPAAEVEAPPAEPPPDRRVLVASSFSELPGWAEDRHAEVLPALRRTCARFAFLGPAATLRPTELGGTVGDWLGFSERATALERELAASGGVTREQRDARVRANSAGTPELTITIRNRTPKTVDGFVFTAELFDSFNSPVICEHKARGSRIWERLCRDGVDVFNGLAQDRVRPRQRRSLGVWSMFHFGAASKAIVTITSVHFTDNSTWSGRCRQEWDPRDPR